MALNELSIQILKAIREEKTNERAINEHEIAEALGIDRDRVYHCLQNLEQAGYIQGLQGSPYFEPDRNEYHGCLLTSKGKVAIDHPEDLMNMSDEFISKILKAIDERHTSEREIALHLNAEQYRVHSALDTLVQKEYIKGARAWKDGKLEYAKCTLTDKGKTMLHHPEDFPQQSQPSIKQDFNFPGSNIASVTGSGHIDKATINNYPPEQRQSLTEAAQEIQELLNQLSQTYNPPSPLNNSKIATAGVEVIESNQALKSKIIKVLKAGGTETFKELIDHPAINIFMACIEAWKDD